MKFAMLALSFLSFIGCYSPTEAEDAHESLQGDIDSAATDGATAAGTAGTAIAANVTEIATLKADLDSLIARVEATEAPTSKDDLYEVRENTTITPNTQTNVLAFCDDANDILVTGGCKHSATSGMIYENRPVFAVDKAEDAYWECGITSRDARTTLSLSAFAICMSVD